MSETDADRKLDWNTGRELERKDQEIYTLRLNLHELECGKYGRNYYSGLVIARDQTIADLREACRVAVEVLSLEYRAIIESGRHNVEEKRMFNITTALATLTKALGDGKGE